MEAQRVVVIQDASREVSSSAIKWALYGLSLKPGDTLTLLSVLHQVNNPSTLSFMAAVKPMGYKSRADSSVLGANQKIVAEEVAKKNKEYQNNWELTLISKIYQTEKIEFKIEVDAGPSPKVVAFEAAKKLRATWVILDRQMKKDKKYFLEKLSCGISRMKRDNKIEKLRGPTATGTNKIPTKRSYTTKIRYDEMIPGSPEDDDLFSIELFPTMSSSSLGSTESTSSCFTEEKSTPHHNLWENSSTSSCFTEEKSTPHHNLWENSTKPKIGTAKMASSNAILSKYAISSTKAHGKIPDEKPTQSSSRENLMAPLKLEESYDNSICTICKNSRAKIGWKKDFTYAELQAATNGFSQESIIFEGRNGGVFRGQLKNMLAIAVEEHKDSNFEGEKKFISEVQTLSKTKHKNVVMLLGSCWDVSQRLLLLVYEYVCNGTLDQHLTNCNPLTWKARMTIAMGVSRGLNHLHANNIIHRDITPKNILLTHDHQPLVGGLGRATQYDSYESSVEQRVAMGTFGYLAPEYAECGKASYKTDIYSFGVVLLELITGRSTKDKRLEGKSLLAWARPLLKQKKYGELVDQRIFIDTHQFNWTVQLAEKCLTKDPHSRPSMDKVVSTLEQIMEGKALGVEKKALIHYQIQ